ncbi:MAG: VWA domain-containing protein [Bryobacterales bacterium]|jgi:VWFA-related protein|nr:VWA domain-containing protein [Bryobacterales bacterium]
MKLGAGIILLIACGTLGFVLATALPAQQAAPSAPGPSPAAQQEVDAPITFDVTRVNVLFSVSDKRGRFVTDLSRDDFQVFENKKPQEVLEFTAETDLPLRIAILVDTSNSIRERFRFEQEAAIGFLNEALRPGQDRAIVVGFDSIPEIQTELSDNLETLSTALREMRPGGGTALYDAIYYTCRDRLGKDQPLYKFRRAMVILSDGEDTQSIRTRDQALELAQKTDVVIYTISTNISRRATTGDKVLRYLAEETGGLSFFPFKVEDLEQSFKNIANELRHQYNLYYRPEPLKTDGSYQKIDLRLQNRKNLQVRARKGYYAPRLP